MPLGDELAQAAMIGLMAGALAACGGGADAPQAPAEAKNGCAGPNGCGQVEETRAADPAAKDEGTQTTKATTNACGGPDGCHGNGCPAKEDAEGTQPATKAEGSCSGKNGCS